MNRAEAKQTLEALANGIDPVTGEIFSGASPFDHPQVIRALFCAVRELDKREKRARPRDLPDNAGKPWPEEEDARLLNGFDAGVPVKELAERHARTRGSIESRLIRHGRLQGTVGRPA
jgi:hypothetical protein